MPNQYEAEERRVFHIEIRDASDAEKQIHGKAVPYGEEAPIGSSYVEVMRAGCMKKSIKEAGRALPLLRWHDSESFPIGKAIAWEERDDGLYGTWQIDDKNPDAIRAYEQARDGYLTGLSVGFTGITADINPGTDTRPPTVVRTECRLVETSLVAAPAYASAQITLVRTAGLVTPAPHLARWRQWWDGQQ
jgi:HK97 family phage prohead protease